MAPKLHPIIAAWRVQGGLAPAARDELSSDTKRRSYRLLDRLFRAAEKKGLKANSDRRDEFYFLLESQRIRCQLRELQVRGERTDASSPWARAHPLKPTGYLVFSIKEYVPHDWGIKREWSEKSRGPLEDKLRDIVDAILRVGRLLIDLQQARERQDRRDRDAAILREQEAAARQAALNMVRALIEQVVRNHTASVARRFLDELESQTKTTLNMVVANRPIDEWLAWARHQIDMYDPLVGGAQRVFEEIASAAGSANESPV